MRQAGPGATRIGQAEDVVWEARGDDAFLSSHLILGAGPDNPYCSPDHRQLSLPARPDGRGVGGPRHPGHRAAGRARSRRGGPRQGLPRLPGQHDQPRRRPTCWRPATRGPRPDDYRSECEMVLDFIQQVWNDRDLEKVTQFMPRDLFLNDIGYRTVDPPRGLPPGSAQAAAALPERSVPDPRHRRPTTRSTTPGCGSRSAGCWSATTTDRRTSGRSPVSATDLLGVSQFLVQNGKIMRETRIYDEIALRAQINAGRGDEPVPFTNIY